ncbi:MAG TPA: 3-methyl-2-oxobutanoate hydroxymethyltransferase, partial [Candidatus Berkiella sp.]|nr:3-methyl-2-oxobutanoate hydroxymethyltransferase [Candidatus Berkiella sp.]
DDNAEIITHIVKSGIPVMGHIGLTPQSVHSLGGFKVQGRQQDAADKILEQALTLQEAGCFSIVLECIPYELAKKISSELAIPTIGIGAGPFTDGQVLVLQDMLGLQTHKPKFLKTFMEGFSLIKTTLDQYNDEVKNSTFPTINEHSYEHSV